MLGCVQELVFVRWIDQGEARLVDIRRASILVISMYDQ